MAAQQSSSQAPHITVDAPTDGGHHPRLLAGAVKYAKRVKEYSVLPDGRGSNHATLARFFARLLSHGIDQLEACPDEEHFALSYSFERTSSADGSWILNDAEDYISCNDFVRKTGSGDLKSASRLLFLRGYPTPEWLGLIGARFKIDPEFFVRFMHFKPAKDGINNYTLPALPAASWNLLELPVISIGERRAFHGLVNQAEVDVMRKEAKTRMHKHHEHLNGHTGVTAGSSVVREVAIFDHGCFALEQRIWICLQRQITSQPNAVEVSTVGAPWTLVIWTDSGRTPNIKAIQDLNILPQEFQTNETFLAPVIHYKANTGLVSHKLRGSGQVRPLKGAEATAQLSTGYGRSLYQDVMAADGFYALTEVFNIATASMNQYNNLIERKLTDFVDEEHYSDFDMLSNLRYSKEILYRQQRHIEHVLAWLRLHRVHSLADWRTTDKEDPKVSRSVDSVVQQYEYLLTHVKALQAQCQDSITNSTSKINLNEVKSSYEQSRRIGRLTFLAAVFAPMAFTTSFFAMNIGLKNLSLSNWVVVTIILTSATLFFMVVDVLGWVKPRYLRWREVVKRAMY